MVKRHVKRIFTRRKAKWSGLVVTALLVALYVGSSWMYMGLSISYSQLNPKYNFGLDVGEPFFSSGVANGVLTVEWALPEEEWAIDTGEVLSRGLRVSPRFGKMQRTSRSMKFGFQRYTTDGPHSESEVLVVPMWLALLVVGVPTAWLWRSDRRIQPWQCRSCRYDLRGIEGGGAVVCPECGQPIGGV